MKIKARIKQIVADFYISSADFNGITLNELGQRLSMHPANLRDQVAKLVGAGELTLAFASISENPYIKRFPDIAAEEQLERLDNEPSTKVCVYPVATLVQSLVDLTQYNERPFTKRLLLCEPQVYPIYFELAVLERYYSDPRFLFSFDDFIGSIGIKDAHYEDGSTNERDKTFLQTFGLGYDEKGNRVVVAFLRHLSRLTPDHQQYWRSFIVPSNCRMHKDLYVAAIEGGWVEHGSVYKAFVEEQRIINEMASLMGKQPLFRRTYDGEKRPKELSFFLRPTTQNYQDFVHLLDKLISENISKDFFSGDIPLETETVRKDGKVVVTQKGTLSLLDEWIRKHIRMRDENIYDEIIKPLRAVRELRQKPAHSLGENQYSTDYYDQQEELMMKVYGSIRLIRMAFALHPRAKSVNVPSWILEAKFVRY